MADDNYSRSYRGNPQRQPERPAGHSSGNDPLAELARLIGQHDPYSDFARGHGRGEQPSHQAAHDAHYREPRQAPPLDWPSAHEQLREPAPPRAFSHEQDYAQPHHYDQGGQDYRQDPRYAEPRADARFPGDQYGRDQAGDAYGYADQAQGYGQQPGYAQQQPGYAARGYPQQPQYPQGHAQQDGRAYAADPYARQMPHDEDMYEQPRPAARRGGLVTVMAVFALAVLGTAAAFGYRAVFGNPGAPATPPVIKASSAPTKVVPATQSSDASGKLIYDRVGDRNQPEKIVSREETPVDLKNAAPPPRVVLSNGITPQAPQSAPLQPQNAPAFANQPAAAKPSSQPTAASTEPKKIRTVTIRPDQPSAAPEPATTHTAQTNAEEAVAAVAPRTTNIPRTPAAQGDPNAPLSLAPAGGSAPRTPTTMRTASAPAQSAPATAGLDGAYSVQVTSQRTEADAQSSYRALQAQFPNVLGAQRAVIRRADLGGRGVYYRALVGSFDSSEQASQFCRSLRDAGGQCVVQRN